MVMVVIIITFTVYALFGIPLLLSFTTKTREFIVVVVSGGERGYDRRRRQL